LGEELLGREGCGVEMVIELRCQCRWGWHYLVGNTRG
jgi:hypothetical protein